MSLQDQGFLADPGAEYGEYMNPEVVSFDAIESTRCLGLLGEPSIAKTHSVESKRDSIALRITPKTGPGVNHCQNTISDPARAVSELRTISGKQLWVGEVPMGLR